MLLVVGLCVIGAAVILTQDAEATVVNVDDPRLIEVSYETLGGQNLFVGDRGVTFHLRVINGFGDTMSDDEPISSVTVSISPMVHDEEGNEVETPVHRWTTMKVDPGVSLQDGSSYLFRDFEFNVKGDAQPMMYNFTVVVDFITTDSEAESYKGYIHWTLRSNVLPGSFPSLYPGEIDRRVSVRLDVQRTLSEMELTLEVPSAEFSFFPGTMAVTTRRPDPSGSDWYPEFLMSVDRFASAETHEAPYTLVYKNTDDVRCTETGIIEIPVRSLVMVELRSVIHTIPQGTTSKDLTLYVRNIGNVELLSLRVTLSSASSRYFWLATDHYEGATAVGPSWIDVGDLAVMEEISVPLGLSIDKTIPQGVHRIMFDFRSYYAEPGLELPFSSSGTWTSVSGLMVPRVTMGSGTITLDPDSYSVTGMDLFMEVSDTEMDVRVSDMLTPTVGPSSRNVELAFKLKNWGKVDYRNVVAMVETGTSLSPFVDPMEGMVGTSAEYAFPTNFNSGDEERVSFHVDLAPDVQPGTYLVPVSVTGEETLSGKAISADLRIRMLVRGTGPILQISTVSPGTIGEGTGFTLSIAIENVGDDTARDVLIVSMSKADWSGAGAPAGQGDACSPVPLRLPVFVGDIVPGNITIAEVHMLCPRGMEDGQVFFLNLTLDYMDSLGAHPTRVDAVKGVSVQVERGVGPVLVISSISPDRIDAGKDFELSMVINNMGDETAHSVILGPCPDVDRMRGDQDGDQGEGSPPEPVTLPLFLGDIEPGSYAVAKVVMCCNPDMVEGRVYPVFLTLDYEDPDGNHPPAIESVQKLSIKTKGSGEAEERSIYDTGNTLLVVVTICLIVVVALYVVSTVARIQSSRGPRPPREGRRPPRPPTPEELPPQSMEPTPSEHHPPEAPPPEEGAQGYSEPTQYDGQEQYPTGEETDVSSYYEKQLWGGEGGGDSG